MSFFGNYGHRAIYDRIYDFYVEIYDLNDMDPDDYEELEASLFDTINLTLLDSFLRENDAYPKCIYGYLTTLEKRGVSIGIDPKKVMAFARKNLPCGKGDVVNMDDYNEVMRWLGYGHFLVKNKN